MKNYLLDILFTLLFFGFFASIIELALHKTPTELSYKDWYMTEKANKIKILLLGNSLFSQSFNPHVLGDSTFDGAAMGRNICYDVEILKKYAPHMNNLKTVIVPVNIGVFGDSVPSTYDQHQYLSNMNIRINHNPLRYSALLSRGFYKKDLTPRMVYTILEEGGEYSSRSIDSLGYITMFRVWDGHSILNGIKQYEDVPKYRETVFKQISAIATECERLGVRLICIQPPATNTLYAKTDPRLYRSLDSIMNRLCNIHEVEYKSYFNDSAFRTDSLYFDELHLNHRGATLLAQQVKKDFNL